MGYPSAVVANWFIEHSLNQNIELTPMKLQKLMYYAHGVNLGATNQPLLDETIEAWRYGPVIRSIYDEVKKYGNQPIPEPINISHFNNKELGESEQQVLESVWDLLKHHSGIQLANMTHTENAPWDKARKLGYKIIDNSIIKEYFSGTGKASTEAA